MKLMCLKNGETLVYDHRFLFDFALDAYFASQARYKKGDVLYVMETWKIDSISKHLNNMLIDFKAIKNGYSQSEVSVNLSKERFDIFKKFYQKNGWQSPYFMPKEAARIFLRVTDVKIERLQDIKYYEVFQEGIESVHLCNSYCLSDKPCAFKQSLGTCCVIQAFKNLWNSTIKKSEFVKYGWDANPYVWVYEFEVISKEEAMKGSVEK